MIGDSTIGLLFRIKADPSDAEKNLKKFNRTVDTETADVKSKIASASSAIGDDLSNLGASVTTLGLQLTSAVTVPVAALAALGVNFNATKEQALVSFGVMLKSADKAKELYSELQKFAAGTPFEMPEIASSAKSLLAFGVAQEKILPTLTQIGDIASGVGIPLNELAEIYGKARVQGRLFSEDINQLTGRGIPIIQELAKQFGTTDDKVKKMVEDGKVGFPQLEQAFKNLTGAGGQFSGMMEAQSKTFTGRLSTLWDTINVFAGELFAPLFTAVSTGLPYLIQAFEFLQQIFSTLSEPAKIAVSAVLGLAAAAGPLLIAFGTILTFLAPLISGIGSLVGSIVAAGSITAFLSGILASLGAVLSIVILPALKIIIPVAIAVGAAFLALAGVAVALYAAWQTNFGGIRDFTLSAWETIKSTVSAAMTFIYGIIQQVGGAIVGWWRENYPLIRQVVQTVSDSIKAYIQSFLDAVRAFWNSHGSAIMDYVQTYWNVLKNIISSVISQIGSYIRLGLQLIRGDWSGAWETLKQILQNTARFLTQIWTGLLQVFWKALKAIVPIVVEYGSKISYTLLTWVGKAVVGVGYIFATLPYQLLKIIPALFRAGMDIAGAIWQGIKEGLGLAASQNPINIPVNTNADIVTNQDITSGATFNNTQPQSSTFSGGGSSNNDAEKRRQEREELAKREAQAQIQILQNQLQEIEREYTESLAKMREKFENSGNKEEFLSEANSALTGFTQEIGETLVYLERLEKQQASTEKKTAKELELLESEQQKRREEFQRKSNAAVDENNRILSESAKKQKENETSLTLQQLKNNLALREAANAKIYAENEKLLALGLIGEEELNRRKRELDAEYLAYKLKNLEAQKIAAAGNADEEARYSQEILLLKEEIARKDIESETAEINDRKKRREDEKKEAEELLALRRQILETEREILDFRAGQERKRLTNAVENSQGKARLEALTKLRDFELIEERRKQKQRAEDLEKEEADAVKRVEGKENEEARKKAIEDLYREARILSEAEFQARLKEIRDGFNPQIEEAEERSTLFGSIIRDIKELFGLGEQLPTLANIFTNFAGMVKNAFAGVASAIGQVVQNWVLYGETGPAVMRKILASALATIAAEAAVRAVFELAAGFAALFFNPAEAAAHFTAAAIYGSIAGVAALAGRAVAGNAFKQQTGAATGGNNSQNSSSGQNRLASAEEALRIIAEDRANPSRNELIIKVESNDSHILDVLESDVSNNGKTRGMFIKLAETV